MRGLYSGDHRGPSLTGDALRRAKKAGSGPMVVCERSGRRVRERVGGSGLETSIKPPLLFSFSFSFFWFKCYTR